MTERATSMLVKARATRVHETVRAGDEARTLPQLPVSTLSPVFLVTWQSYFQSPVVRPVPGAKQQNESWGRRRLNTRDFTNSPPTVQMRTRCHLLAVPWCRPMLMPMYSPWIQCHMSLLLPIPLVLLTFHNLQTAV